MQGDSPGGFLTRPVGLGSPCPGSHGAPGGTLLPRYSPRTCSRGSPPSHSGTRHSFGKHGR